MHHPCSSHDTALIHTSCQVESHAIANSSTVCATCLVVRGSSIHIYRACLLQDCSRQQNLNHQSSRGPYKEDSLLDFLQYDHFRLSQILELLPSISGITRNSSQFLPADFTTKMSSSRHTSASHKSGTHRSGRPDEAPRAPTEYPDSTASAQPSQHGGKSQARSEVSAITRTSSSHGGGSRHGGSKHGNDHRSSVTTRQMDHAGRSNRYSPAAQRGPPTAHREPARPTGQDIPRPSPSQAGPEREVVTLRAEDLQTRVSESGRSRHSSATARPSRHGEGNGGAGTQLVVASQSGRSQAPSRHGGSRHGGSRAPTQHEGSRHGEPSRHGGSRHGTPSRHGGSRAPTQYEGSRHGEPSRHGSSHHGAPSQHGESRHGGSCQHGPSRPDAGSQALVRYDPSRASASPSQRSVRDGIVRSGGHHEIANWQQNGAANPPTVVNHYTYIDVSCALNFISFPTLPTKFD